MEEVPSSWTVDRVLLWLDGAGLGHLGRTFRKNCVDGNALLSLQKSDLKDELCIDALSDRKALWERLEGLRIRKVSPVPVPEKVGSRSPMASTHGITTNYSTRSPPATGSGGDRCEQCFKLFSISDVPILLTLPGASRAAHLHHHCKETWARRHAKTCGHCYEPMTQKITTLSGSFGKVELHPECEQAWAAANAKKCDHCGKAMPTDVTTLTGTFGKAEVHPECVAAFERTLREGRQSPRAGSSSPRHVPGPGKCEECFRRFEAYDKPILFTLPGAVRAAELHPHCKTAWSKRHAKRCAFCSEPMIIDITTLSGAWGSAELHPDCVSAFERSKGVRSVSGSAVSGDRCAHCHRAFLDGEIAAVVTLPGETTSVKLHTACRTEWSMLHAKLCEHCGKPMPTDVTTISGAWGSAEIHPTCVQSFKDSLAAGRYPSRGAGSPARVHSGSPRRSPSPSTSPSRSSSGRYYSGTTPSPPSPSHCYQCGLSFAPSESVSILTVEDLSHSVHLHDRCIDAFHRRMGHVCSWCSGTITGHMTKLKGTFGSATLHPDCLLPFKTSRNIL